MRRLSNILFSVDETVSKLEKNIKDKQPVSSGDKLVIGDDINLDIELKNVTIKLPISKIGLYRNGNEGETVIIKKFNNSNYLTWNLPPYEYMAILSNNKDHEIEFNNNKFSLSEVMHFDYQKNSPFTMFENALICLVSGYYLITINLNFYYANSSEFRLTLFNYTTGKELQSTMFGLTNLSSLNISFIEKLESNNYYDILLYNRFNNTYNKLIIEKESRINFTCQSLI